MTFYKHLRKPLTIRLFPIEHSADVLVERAEQNAPQRAINLSSTLLSKQSCMFEYDCQDPVRELIHVVRWTQLEAFFF